MVTTNTNGHPTYGIYGHIWGIIGKYQCMLHANYIGQHHNVISLLPLNMGSMAMMVVQHTQHMQWGKNGNQQC